MLEMPNSMLRLCHNTADPHYRLFKKMDSLYTHIDTSLMLQGPRHMGKA